jgi:double-strand break repair protein MRE11
LSDGESKKKQVVILTVTGSEFGTETVSLKSVRPFVMMDVTLKEVVPKLNPSDSKSINSYLCARIDELIEASRQLWFEDNTELEPPLPLVRLRVDYSSDNSEDLGGIFSIMNPQRFGQQFIGKVANPRDVVHFMRKRSVAASLQKKRHETVIIPDDGGDQSNGPSATRVEDLVTQYLNVQHLDLFPQNEFCDIVRLAVEKDERDAIEEFIKSSLIRVVGSLKERPEIGGLERATLNDEFERTKKLREDEWERLHPGMDALFISRTTKSENFTNNCSDDEMSQSAAVKGRGRGARKSAMSSTTAAGRGRGRGRAKIPAISYEGSDEPEPTYRPPRRTSAPNKQSTVTQPRLAFSEDSAIVADTFIQFSSIHRSSALPSTPQWPSRKK